MAPLLKLCRFIPLLWHQLGKFDSFEMTVTRMHQITNFKPKLKHLAENQKKFTYSNCLQLAQLWLELKTWI